MSNGSRRPGISNQPVIQLSPSGKFPSGGKFSNVKLISGVAPLDMGGLFVRTRQQSTSRDLLPEFSDRGHWHLAQNSLQERIVSYHDRVCARQSSFKNHGESSLGRDLGKSGHLS